MSKLFTNINSVSISVNNSSLVSEIEWEGNGKTKTNPKGALTLTFKNGGERYEYTEVPATIIEEMLESDSMGKFFHKNIKDQYDTYKEVE